jgi:hypothetical protein
MVRGAFHVSGCSEPGGFEQIDAIKQALLAFLEDEFEIIRGNL